MGSSTEQIRYEVTVRPRPDLPPHVLGRVQWDTQKQVYYIQEEKKKRPVEFINNYWYRLKVRKGESLPYTTEEERIDRYDNGTGFWNTGDPEHPDNQRVGPSTPLISRLIPVPESEAGSTPGSPSFTEARSRSASIETEKPESSSSGDTTSTESDPDQSIHDPEEQQQEEVLAAQFEHGLDIEERLPADPEYPDEPVHLQQVEQAIEAGAEIQPIPLTIESTFTDPSWLPIPLLEEIEYFAHQSPVLPPEPEPITIQPPYQWYPQTQPPTPPIPLTPFQALTPPLQMAHQQPPHQAAGGGQAAGGQQAAGGGQQFTDKLRGVVPAMFNGNRNKSEDFSMHYHLCVEITLKIG